MDVTALDRHSICTHIYTKLLKHAKKDGYYNVPDKYTQKKQLTFKSGNEVVMYHNISIPSVSADKGCKINYWGQPKMNISASVMIKLYTRYFD